MADFKRLMQEVCGGAEKNYGRPQSSPCPTLMELSNSNRRNSAFSVLLLINKF